MDSILIFLKDALTATAIKTAIPKAYGPLHLSFMLIGFLVSYLLARKLRHLSDRGNRRLLLGIGIFLLLTEVYKQLLYCLVISPEAYQWGIFPFHLCSVPMYLCIIAPLLKKGPVQQGMYNFMMLYNLLGGAIAFLEPSGLLHPYATLTAHALVWHMSLVFIGLYLMCSGRGGSDGNAYKGATITFLALCAVAFYINLSFWNISGGRLNMFFVGPANSSLIVFKQIAEAFGWFTGTAVYIPAVCLGAYILLRLIRLYHAKTHMKVKNAEG